MSFLDLYMNKNPLITGSDEGGEPIATIFGVPFDATHSECRTLPSELGGKT